MEKLFKGIKIMEGSKAMRNKKGLPDLPIGPPGNTRKMTNSERDG